MVLSRNAQAILLLTARLGRADREGVKHLAPREWHRFIRWLAARNLPPEALLRPDAGTLVAEYPGRDLDRERVEALLGRSVSLGLAAERWERAGLWVLTAADDAYPERVARRLGESAPPFLIGCGERSQLRASPAVAIVGSRDATEADLGFARDLAADLAREGHVIVSGGARGVDEAAAHGALAAGGAVVAILADGLLRASASPRYREALRARTLTLATPFNPEVGFDIGNAMARNKHIYTLADEAVVIATHWGKGGTWQGAMENLRQRWVPLWVKEAEAPGHVALVREGARWLAERQSAAADGSGQGTASVPDIAADGTPQRSVPASERFREPSATERGVPVASDLPLAAPASQVVRSIRETHSTRYEQAVVLSASNDDEAYARFLSKTLYPLLDAGTTTLRHLVAESNTSEAQLKRWLARAVADGHVRKERSRPARYVRAQPSLFALASADSGAATTADRIRGRAAAAPTTA